LSFVPPPERSACHVQAGSGHLEAGLCGPIGSAKSVMDHNIMLGVRDCRTTHLAGNPRAIDDQSDYDHHAALDQGAAFVSSHREYPNTPALYI